VSATPTIDRAYYDNTYYVGHLARLTRHDRFTRVKVQRAMSLLTPQAGELVVDLGSGVGTITAHLSKIGVRVFSMDYSFASLRLAARALKEIGRDEAFAGICCDGGNIALADCSIDGVTAVDFTEHIDDTLLDAVARDVFRILKPGGRFVVYTPNNGHLFEILKERNIVLKKDHSHIGLRPMSAYRETLSRAGFAIDEAYYEPTHIPVFGAVERMLMPLPVVGGLCRRRICISGRRPAVG
jgi:SAM-dependent methyltransferase